MWGVAEVEDGRSLATDAAQRAYGGHTDANEAWVAGVLTLSGTPPAGATGAAVLAVPEDCREQWEERAAIMEWDGHMPRAAAERLAWVILPHQLQQE